MRGPLHNVPFPAINTIADAVDPRCPPDGDRVLLLIHAELESAGRASAERAVSVFHRNLVLSAVANALRSQIPR